MNNIIGDKLKRIRQERNLTLDQLSDLLNEHYNGAFSFSKGKLSKWENGKEEPRLSSIKMLTDFYGMNIDELYTTNKKSDISSLFDKLNITRQKSVYNFALDQLNKQNNILSFKPKNNILLFNPKSTSECDDTIKEEHGLYRVSKLSTLSAGTGIIDLDPSHAEDVYVKNPPPNNYDIAFQVSGDSMEPLFEDGEMIYVKKTTELCNGQIVAIILNGEAYVKKAYKDSNLRLVSLNKKYDDIIADENDDIELVGKVVF